MRIALTLDRDAGKREENDYVGSLLDAGFRREEIDLVEPGSPPPAEMDGLVLGGGCDVDPKRYGKFPRADAKLELDEGRDATDFAAFEKARREGVPVFGICRGLQVVNVAMGGSLIQDIPSELPSGISHQRPPRAKTRLDHDVEVTPGTRLWSLVKRSTIPVNSRHHQAILAPAPGLRCAARAPDGLVEALESEPDPWLLAVQWHPENLRSDSVSRALFADFMRAVRERAAAGIPRPPVLLSPA